METIKAIKQEIDNTETRYKLDKQKACEICSEYMKNMRTFLSSKNIKALKTGLKFENYFHGYHPGDYFIFAARPKMEKPHNPEDICPYHCFSKGRVLCSSPMRWTKQLIMNRIVSIISGVSLSTIYDGMFTDSELKSITKAIDEIEKMKLHLYCLKFQNVYWPR